MTIVLSEARQALDMTNSIGWDSLHTPAGSRASFQDNMQAQHMQSLLVLSRHRVAPKRADQLVCLALLSKAQEAHGLLLSTVVIASAGRGHKQGPLILNHSPTRIVSMHMPVSWRTDRQRYECAQQCPNGMSHLHAAFSQ